MWDAIEVETKEEGVKIKVELMNIGEKPEELTAEEF